MSLSLSQRMQAPGDVARNAPHQQELWSKKQDQSCRAAAMQPMPSPAALLIKTVKLATVAAAGQSRQPEPLLPSQNTGVTSQNSEILRLDCQPHSLSDRLILKAPASTGAAPTTEQSLREATPGPPSSQPTRIPAPELPGGAALIGLPCDAASEKRSPVPTLPIPDAPASYSNAPQTEHWRPLPRDHSPNLPKGMPPQAAFPGIPEESPLEFPPPSEPVSGREGSHPPDLEGRGSGPPTKRSKSSVACAHGRLRRRCSECKDSVSCGQAP
jgi:hypothetical protein